jgi:tetraacyldisaccharide 4'-kinase
MLMKFIKYLIMKLKKPKFWDYNKPNFISNLLYPLSKLVEIRSNLIETKNKKFNEIKTICVGNIYLGGTGKTSIAIELKKILDKQSIKTCFIKKRYSNQIDEQKLLKKFGKTFIDKSRIKALKSAMSENYKIAIFDDGLQDKDISYDLSFACFNKKNFIGNGRTIPAGPLREPLNKLEEYKNVFLNGNDEDKKNLEKILIQKFPHLNLYESQYRPLNLDQLNLNKQYIVFSGIGNHQTFIDMLKKNKFKIIQDFEFPDHYNYNQRDIKKINKIALKNYAKILTTQKDYLRLSNELRSGIDFIEVDLKITQIEMLKNRLVKFIKNENN